METNTNHKNEEMKKEIKILRKRAGLRQNRLFANPFAEVVFWVGAIVRLVGFVGEFIIQVSGWIDGVATKKKRGE